MAEPKHFYMQRSSWGVFGKAPDGSYTIREDEPSRACYAGMGTIAGDLLVSAIRTSMNYNIWHEVAKDLFPDCVYPAVKIFGKRSQLPEGTQKFAEKAAKCLRQDVDADGDFGEFDEVILGEGQAHTFYVVIDLTLVSWADVFLILNWYRMLQEKATTAEPIMDLYLAGVPLNSAIPYALFATGDSSSGHHTFGYYYCMEVRNGVMPDYKRNWTNEISREKKANVDTGGARRYNYAKTIGQGYGAMDPFGRLEYNNKPAWYLHIPLVDLVVTKGSNELLKILDTIIPGSAYISDKQEAA